MKMNQEQKQLYKEFEKEVWLYLDNDLPEERMKYWEEQLQKYPGLNSYIQDYNFVAENIYSGTSWKNAPRGTPFFSQIQLKSSHCLVSPWSTSV